MKSFIKAMRNKKIFSFLLDLFAFPFSLAWQWCCRLRRFFYMCGLFVQQDFHVPILSVGNLVFGGTGKTPFILWLGKYLNSKDKKIMVLMRGYKGKLEKSFGILRSKNQLGFNPLDYGDEAVLLAQSLERASVVVGKKRAHNLEFYFEQEKPDVVLLDDGHQHIQLQRRLNIVLFDALTPIHRYRVVPRGELREGMEALKEADLIILSRCDRVEPYKREELKKFLNRYLSSPVAFAEIRYAPLGFFDSHGRMIFDIGEIKDRKVICLAGLASPRSFFDLTKNLGAHIVDQITLPDHHFFTEKEIKDLLERANREEALLVTTQKDMVKIKKIIKNKKILYLDIHVEFMSGEEETKRVIDQAISPDFY